MDEKLRKLIEMGRKVQCPRCQHEWSPELLKDKRCPDCQITLVKEIELALGR
jgi:Zn finger protein HypA/HybF involved in hydrogenase expression